MLSAVEPDGSSPVWALGDQAVLVDGVGTIVERTPLDGDACCAVALPALGDAIWLAMSSGDVLHVYPGAVDLVVNAPYPTDDPDEGGGPHAITTTGLSVWLVQGAWLTQVQFPQ